VGVESLAGVVRGADHAPEVGARGVGVVPLAAGVEVDDALVGGGNADERRGGDARAGGNRGGYSVEKLREGEAGAPIDELATSAHVEAERVVVGGRAVAEVQLVPIAVQEGLEPRIAAVIKAVARGEVTVPEAGADEGRVGVVPRSPGEN